MCSSDLGGGTDIGTRIVAQKLSQLWGQSVVVDNKGGAGGNLGLEVVSRAKPDGYTLLTGNVGTQSINPTLYKKLNYNPDTAFTPIGLFAELPFVLAVNANFPAKNVAELVEYAKKNQDKMSYGSAGTGSATHLACVVLDVAMGTHITHVPYRGTPEALTETASGRIDWFFAPLVSALPLIQSGRLQALAVSTAQRSPLLPNVPSISEAGFANAAYTFWVGLFVTAKTPKPIVQKLHAGVMSVLAMPDVKDRLEKLGAAAMPMQQDAFEKYLDAETLAAAQLVKAAGIRIE